jgi:hypothetical protein
MMNASNPYTDKRKINAPNFVKVPDRLTGGIFIVKKRAPTYAFKIQILPSAKSRIAQMLQS